MIVIAVDEGAGGHAAVRRSLGNARVKMLVRRICLDGPAGEAAVRAPYLDAQYYGAAMTSNAAVKMTAIRFNVNRPKARSCRVGPSLRP